MPPPSGLEYRRYGVGTTLNWCRVAHLLRTLQRVSSSDTKLKQAQTALAALRGTDECVRPYTLNFRLPTPRPRATVWCPNLFDRSVHTYVIRRQRSTHATLV